MSEYVREDEITGLLSAMVQSQTVNPPVDTTACAAILKSVLDAEGIDVHLVEPVPGAVNVVGILRGQRPGKTLVLNGHIDTVPAGDGWTTDPFSGEVRDGFLYGRGSCDMKSGVAAMLMAMVGIKRSGLPFDGEIIFQAVADEETGSLHGTRHLLDHGYGADADFAICTEPTSLRVELGNRGLRWLDVTVRGIASHAGRPQLGRNAISVASELIAAIDAIEFEQRNDAFEIPTPSISVTTITGGHTANVIPDHCTFSIDCRMLPGETGDDVLAGIEQAFAPIRARHADCEVDITVREGYWNPFLIDAGEPVVRAVADAVEEVTATRPVFGSKAACTDASHLVTLAGVPTVLFGPGNETLSHKPDERVAVADLVLATKILTTACQMLLTPGTSIAHG
jgi:succinyl-diaminopimelate desuccinylase